MEEVEMVCFLVTRLTPAQRSVLARMPAAAAETWMLAEPEEALVARGLCRIGVLSADPYLGDCFQRTVEGDAVMEVLIDTEVVRCRRRSRSRKHNGYRRWSIPPKCAPGVARSRE